MRDEMASGARAYLWWLYAAAWLPYMGVYALTLGYTIGIPLPQAVIGAVANVLPPALLGIGVIRYCQGTTWPAESRRRFFARHVVVALGYAVLSAIGAFTLLLAERGLRGGEWQSLKSIDPRPLSWQFFIALLLYLVLASATYTVGLVVRLREEEARAARARELQTRAELKALRARLNPHFLFNTLHSLLALVRSDPSAAEEALEQFGDLLHYALQSGREQGEEVNLSEEWKFIADYLALEQLRLGERLRVDARASQEALNCRVPALCLQPLVENAIRYAIAPRAAGGRIWIEAETRDGDLLIEVRDDGPGPAAAAGPEGRRSRIRTGTSGQPEVTDGGGLGLRLVRERLSALHGEAAGLEVSAASGSGFRVALRIPASITPRPDQA